MNNLYLLIPESRDGCEMPTTPEGMPAEKLGEHLAQLLSAWQRQGYFSNANRERIPVHELSFRIEPAKLDPLELPGVTLTLAGTEYTGTIVRAEYAENGNAALTFEDSETCEHIADLSKNIGIECDENHAYIKDYAENEGVLAQLTALQIVRYTGTSERSGHAALPLVEIIHEELRR